MHYYLSLICLIFALNQAFALSWIPHKIRCPNDTILFHNSACLLKNAHHGTFTYAVKFCHALGGRLPSVVGRIPNDLYRKILGTKFWVDAVSVGEEFYNIEGRKIERNGRDFKIDFQPLQMDTKPDSRGSSEIVCGLGEASSYTGWWVFGQLPLTYHSADCGRIQAIHCVVPPEEPECPPGWRINKDNEQCYKYVRQDVNLFEANALCKLNDGDLVSIHNAQENQFVADLIPERDPAWIGLVDGQYKFGIDPAKPLQFKNSLTWLDDSKVDFLSWEHRYNKERSLGRENIKHCFTLRKSRDGYNDWLGDDCDVKASGFVCKKDPRPSTTWSLVNDFRRNLIVP